MEFKERSHFRNTKAQGEAASDKELQQDSQNF